MQAVRVPRGRPLAPFDEAPEALRVLDQPLAQVQDRALAEAGFERVAEPPADQPFLVLSDRTWITAEALRRLRAACGGRPGRLRVADPVFLAATGSLQALDAPGLYEVAILPPGPPDLSRAPPVDVDLGLEDADLPALHPRMQHAARPLRLGAAMVFQLDHWMHLVRVNQLALAARAAAEKLAFERRGWLGKAWIVLKILARARSINGYRIARALSQVGKGCDIHPTAVVEVSQLGEGVKVGPHAVVRGSVLGDGAVVDEHATVNFSVVGQGAHVGRFAMLNLSTLWPGAWVSWCNGTQACVIGRDAFVAWGATLLDMSFGRTIAVEHQGARVDSGEHFLGVAVGHRAVVGHGVKVNYGVAVPGDAVLVGGPEGLLRGWQDAPVGEPCRVEQGRPVPVRRG
ncbi:hypothetical protein L6R53_28915 [Myxococcota bacterium]|nr:hypothetical protein [Myxococcota bacterium]